MRLELEEIATQVDAKSLAAFQTAKQKQVNAIMTHGNPRFFAERKRIVELAEKYRLAAIYHESAFVDTGGLMLTRRSTTIFSGARLFTSTRS